MSDASAAETGISPNLQDPKADPQYIQFKCLPAGGPLNRWSHAITREHDYPGAQVRGHPISRKACSHTST